MYKRVTLVLIILLLFTSYTNVQSSWELYDRVIAVVNDVPIVESELLNRFRNKNRRKRIPGRRINYEKSRILDELIENAILYETARNESILVNDDRVMAYLEKIMKPYFVNKLQIKNSKKYLAKISEISERILAKKQGKKLKKNKELDEYADQFISFIEAKNKVPFIDYFEETRIQIRKEQIMSVAIGVSPPSKEEVKDWYDKNRGKLGVEIWVKHILIKAKKGSLTSQRATYKKLNNIRDKIVKGASFESMARKYSQDPGSASRGGDIGWMHISALDPYFASNVYKMTNRGEISPVFKSSFGYHIAKYMGRKVASFETMERMIMYKLHTENLKRQYTKWVELQKRTADIKIYMRDYITKK